MIKPSREELIRAYDLVLMDLNDQRQWADDQRAVSRGHARLGWKGLREEYEEKIKPIEDERRRITQGRRI